MDRLTETLLWVTLASAAIPLGAVLAMWARIHPRWLETEFRHTIIAMGVGTLVAAVSLVLVPAGLARLGPFAAAASFAAGGLVFFLVDWRIEQSGHSNAQFMAMLLDFVPEALAMGAMLTSNKAAGVLLVLLIMLQNLPEGFNAYRELAAKRQHSPARIITWFCALVCLGPLAALMGQLYFTGHQPFMGGLMLFAAGGILYLIFQDIAPQVRLRRRWAPPLGVVLGFLVGLVGQAILGV